MVKLTRSDPVMISIETSHGSNTEVSGVS
jgi:hypothetical protein